MSHGYNLRNLKRHLNLNLNTVSPINTLPPEILSNIFLFLMLTTSFVRDSFDSHGRAHQWLRCTHVCRHWRQVALQSPILWSFITLGADYPSLEAIRTFVSRSVQAPLHIFVRQTDRPGDPPLSSERFDVIWNEVHRIEEFESSYEFMTRQDHRPAFVSLPATALRRLKVRSYIQWRHSSDEHARALELSGNRKANMPGLQMLSCCFVPQVKLLLLPTLTRLRLFMGPGHVSVSSLIICLLDTPLLQYLKLECHHCNNANDAQAPRRVNLPRLRELVLFSRVNRHCSDILAEVLQRLVFPTPARISYKGLVTSNDFFRSPSEYASLCSDIFNRSEYGARPPTEELHSLFYAEFDEDLNSIELTLQSQNPNGM